MQPDNKAKGNLGSGESFPGLLALCGGLYLLCYCLDLLRIVIQALLRKKAVPLSPECWKFPLVPDVYFRLFRQNYVKKGTRASSHGCLSLPPKTHLTRHSCCQTYLTPAAELTQPHPVPAPKSRQLESNLEAIHHSRLSSRVHSSGNTFQSGRLEYDWRRERQ